MITALLEDLESQRPAAIARAVSMVENRQPGANELLASLHSAVSRARRIGITGPPGAGKSTVTMQLARRYRAAGLTVGVIAVDPTSPVSGGALLGDRIRMESVAVDRGVFIRSMATRGSLGGLASATRDVADVLDAAGFDRLIIETVGVGQSEVDVTRVADSSVLLFVPESGDVIQTLKAGLLEVADVFAVNKFDRPGGESLVHELESLIARRRESVPGAWAPPVLALTARDAVGIDELAAALDSHFGWLAESGELKSRRRARLRERVRDAISERMRERVWASGLADRVIDRELPALEAGRSSPLTVADAVLAAASGTSLTT